MTTLLCVARLRRSIGEEAARGTLPRKFRGDVAFPGGSRVHLERQDRIRRWLRAHPEYRAAVLGWLAVFRLDPFGEALDYVEVPNRHNERLFQYLIEAVPMPLIIVIHRYPDANGVYRARVLAPHSPDEILRNE